MQKHSPTTSTLWSGQPRAFSLTSNPAEWQKSTHMEYTHRAEQFRVQAADCRRHAAAARDARMRTHWEELAASYDQLAEQAMNLSSLKRETKKAASLYPPPPQR